MRAPILALVLASIPALASAQEAPPPAAPPAGDVVAAAAPAENAAREEDPNIDRVFLMPSAETQKAGSVSFNDYELLFLGATYGVTDDLQISGLVFAPVVKNSPLLFNATAKLRVIKTAGFRLSLQGGLTYIDSGSSSSDGSSTDGSALGATGGAIVGICLDGECRSEITASVTAVTPLADNTSSNAFAMLYSGGVTARVSSHIKLLGEVTSAGAVDTDGNLTNIDGALVGYGLRFFSQNIAGDVGFVKPIGGNDDSPIGYPFINFTYRQ